MRPTLLSWFLLVGCDPTATTDAGSDVPGVDVQVADTAGLDAPGLDAHGEDVASIDAPRADAGGGAEVIGTVGSYADMHLGDHPVYSIDMAEEDYAVHYNGGGVGTGTSTHHPDGWWDGGAFSRMTPPTVDGLERGIGVHDVWRGATIPIQEINLRFEWRGSPRLGSLWNGSKFLISHWRETLAPGDAETRPMLFGGQVSFAAEPGFERADTIVFAPAQGTVQAWGEVEYADAYPPLTYWATGRQSFYVADDTDVASGTFLDRPLFGASEIITFEVRLVSVARPGYPRGFIGMRVYRRNGDVFTRSASWDIDAAEDLGDYFSEFQQFGCGQHNTAPAPDPDLYFDVGGYITLARDLGGWMGPRAGFVE